MDEALAAFRQYLTAEKRASAHTLRAYLHDLEELVAHATRTFGHAPALAELDVAVCRSYLASLHGANDAVTIGRKLSSLRAFFRLAVRRRLLRSSPVAALRAPKRAKRLPMFLGKDDVGRLLDGNGARPDAGKDEPAPGDKLVDGGQASVEVAWPGQPRAELRPWRLAKGVFSRFGQEMSALSPACDIR